MALPEPARVVPPASVDEAIAMLADVDVRDEELQVVSEELRVQQEQIASLLTRHETEARWRSHLSALVPLGLAVTDGYGKLLDVNPALATTVRVGLGRLRGKPLSVFLAPEDVAPFRTALRRLVGGTEQQLQVTLRPRGGPEVPAELFGFAEEPATAPGAARLQWVVTPVADADAGDGDADAEEGPAEVLGLAAAFAAMSALPVGEPDRQRMLSRMAILVRSAVPGADWVSITMGSPLDPQRLGSDSPQAQDFDGRQLQEEEGPCLDAHTTGEQVVTGDVTTDGRWPRLCRNPGTAVRSVLAIPVRDGDETIGVVNIYGGRTDAFGPANRRIGELAAAAATGVLQSVSERESLRALAANLERALTSRAVIDQAKGVLLARLGGTADEAFARLVTLSSHVNVKLRDLARLVVEGDTEVIARISAPPGP